MADIKEKKEFKKRPEKPGMPGKALPPKVEENENFRGIVRIAGRDLDGHLSLYRGLLKVKGIGSNLARVLERVIVRELKIPAKTRCGDLTDEQIDAVDALLKNPEKHGVMWYSLNRSKDTEAGYSRHVLMNDLVFALRQDLQKEKELRSWRGWRHSIGQRVRGQHSRTTGRTGLTMGVLRKSIAAQKSAGAAGAPATEEKKK
jgi:small subunit ribosomal protein S13